MATHRIAVIADTGLRSAGMRLEPLGEGAAAARVLGAVTRILRGGRARTPDLGGGARTAEVGDAVVAALAHAA